MKLILAREQSQGISRHTGFSITATIEVNDEEMANIKKYKLGREILLSNMSDRGKGILGFIFRKSVGVELTVDSLLHGKKARCNNVIEMLELEKTIVEVAQSFKQVLEVSANFGGETVIEL